MQIKHGIRKMQNCIHIYLYTVKMEILILIYYVMYLIILLLLS